MNILNSLIFINQHPLSRKSRIAALIRWLRWQVGSRLVPGPVIVPFVNNMSLIVRPGMTGATGNIFCGLHEFEDMSLVLHALKPNDIFVDVGANVGAYTMIGAVVGAHCISIEPIPSTYSWLLKNIIINDLDDQVDALNIGVGREEGILRFTNGFDTINHVVSNDEVGIGTIDVSVKTLDSILKGVVPTLIKIDVEGFESEVMAGAEQTFCSPDLLAVIMELNGSGNRYGFDEEVLHQRMIDHGFKTYRYEPFGRRLKSLHGSRHNTGNTLYVRDENQLAERVQRAPNFKLGTGALI